MCSPKLLLLVSLFAFFSLPLIFTLLAASISHFLTANFHVFLRTKFVSFVLYLTLYLFPCYPHREIESLKKVRNVEEFFMYLRYDVIVLDW